jgi:predicted alpha/beta-hydrolase family hydrolase
MTQRSSFELGVVSIPLSTGGSVSAIVGEPLNLEANPGCAIILGHGARNDMHHPLIAQFHGALAAAGILAVRFNFPYREQDRPAPDRAPVLVNCFRDAVRFVRERYHPRYLFLGGKSLGGRIASHLVAEGETCHGLIFLGYPLVSPGLELTVQDVHLDQVTSPMLFLAGTRDELAPIEQLRQVVMNLGKHARLFTIDDADHSLVPSKRSKLTPAQIIQSLTSETLGFMRDVIGAPLGTPSGSAP